MILAICVNLFWYFWPRNMIIHIQKMNSASTRNYRSPFSDLVSHFSFSFLRTFGRNFERSAWISNVRPKFGHFKKSGVIGNSGKTLISEKKAYLEILENHVAWKRRDIWKMRPNLQNYIKNDNDNNPNVPPKLRTLEAHLWTFYASSKFFPHIPGGSCSVVFQLVQYAEEHA